MARQKRIAAEGFKGVFLVASVSPATGEDDHIIYIRYKREGTLYEEKVGRTSEKAPKPNHKKYWSPFLASLLRADKIRGKEPTNAERRADERAVKEAEAERWTVSRLWESYKDAKVLSVKRAQADKSRFNKYLSKPFGKKEPHEIDSLSVARLKKSLCDKNLAPATVWGVLELLRRIINFGVGIGKCKPLSFKIDMPTIDNEKTEYMDDDQLRAYLKALDAEPDQDDAAFFRVMLLTGIRRGALLNVRWNDIDFEKSFLTLRGEVAKGGKTKTIPLSQGVMDVLKGISHRGSDYLWPGKERGPREDFRRMGRRLREKAGLPKSFRPCHGLRHHFATALASSGEVDLYVLQRLLTHGSPAMTARYGHLTDDALKRAAAVADSILDVGQGEKVLEMNGKK